MHISCLNVIRTVLAADRSMINRHVVHRFIVRRRMCAILYHLLVSIKFQYCMTDICNVAEHMPSILLSRDLSDSRIILADKGRVRNSCSSDEISISGEAALVTLT
jgi:hypothetical protein